MRFLSTPILRLLISPLYTGLTEAHFQLNIKQIWGAHSGVISAARWVEQARETSAACVWSVLISADECEPESTWGSIGASSENAWDNILGLNLCSSHSLDAMKNALYPRQTVGWATRDQLCSSAKTRGELNLLSMSFIFRPFRQPS